MDSARRGAVIVIVALLALAIGACGRDSSCTLREDGTASCGVLLGITTQKPTLEYLAVAEEFAGRSFDLVYRFHEIDDEVPTDEERQIVASGRALHLSIDTRVDNAREGLTWQGVVSGSHDDELTSTARGLAELGRPVFVTYEHEMDQEFKRVLGSSTDFIAAWRHVHDVFEAAGATNVIWVWVATGTEPSIPRAREMWPGNDVVDWISWDVYNASGCRAGAVNPRRRVSFEESFEVFHTFLQTEGPSLDIDIDKPKMISETGSVLYPGEPDSTAEFYASMPAVLEKYPDVRAVGLWDHTGIATCDYRFSGVEPVRDAIRDLGASDTFATLELEP